MPSGGWKTSKRNPLSSTSYQVRRLRHLQRNPLCSGPDSVCQREDRVSAAVELDHIIPRIKGGDVWDVNNWQGLCAECHRQKSLRDKGYLVTPPKARIGIDGYPSQTG